MYCKNCGQEIKENQKYCPTCGVPIEHTLDEVPIDNEPLNFGGPVHRPVIQSPIDQSNTGESQYQNNMNAPQNNVPPQYGGMPQNNVPPQYGGMPQYSNVPSYVAPRKKENKLVVALLLGLVALFIFGSIASFVVKVYKGMNSGTYNSAFDNDNTEEEDSDTYTTVEETDQDSEDKSGSTEYAAEDYTGPYDYFNDEWVVPVQGAFVSSSGFVNSEYLGDSMSLAQTTDLKKSMALVNGLKFIYFDKDASDIDFAPDAHCADIAPKGGDMFYVISAGEKDGIELGKLYIIDTDNGKTELIAEDVASISPVISPSGKYVAYSRYSETDGDFILCVGGKDLEEELVTIGVLSPICVSDDKQVVFFNQDESSIDAFDGAVCYPIFENCEITDTFINTDCNEILGTGKDGTYYYKFNNSEGEKKIFDSKLSGIFTDCLNQPYGQIANTKYCDVPSLTDILFISKDGTVFAINNDGHGVTKLPHAFSELSNVIMDSEGSARKVLYSCDGKLYRFDFDDSKSVESVVYEDITVDNFVCSYDLKKIWLISGSEIYYLEKDKATLVASGLAPHSDPLEDGIMWNIEDNWLYYLKGGKLYRVNTKEDSNQVVSDDASILTNVYGKLYYLNEARTGVYLFMDGEFKKVL